VDRLRELSKPNLTYAVIAEASHDIMFRSAETMKADPAALQIEAPQAPAYFMLLASWLTRHAFRQ